MTKKNRDRRVRARRARRKASLFNSLYGGYERDEQWFRLDPRTLITQDDTAKFRRYYLDEWLKAERKKHGIRRHNWGKTKPYYAPGQVPDPTLEERPPGTLYI